jgi:hypothetical protein
MWGYDNDVPAAGLILNIAYGYNVRECEDPFVALSPTRLHVTPSKLAALAQCCATCSRCVSSSLKLAKDLTRAVPGDFLTSSSGASKTPAGVVPICPVQTACLFTRGLVLKMFDAPFNGSRARSCVSFPTLARSWELIFRIVG